MTLQETATKNLILAGEVGSTAFGTAVDPNPDHDVMGVFIEPEENVLGLSPLEHYTHRDQPQGVKSKPGDTELTYYSLRKFCRLAAKGNPTILSLLWLKDYSTVGPIARDLIAIRTAFNSKEAGKSFLGYLTSQKMRFTGERSRTVNRPDLVEKHGYDTKFAMHALRLGLQGIELMQEGRLSIPIKNPQLTTLRDVRNGLIDKKSVLHLIEFVESKLEDLVDSCSMEANYEAINEFMVGAHQEFWCR